MLRRCAPSVAVSVLAVSLMAAVLLAAARPAVAGPTLLFEPTSGKVLYSEDADDLWHPASLTKMMTAYVAFDALKSGRLKLDQKIPVSDKAAAQSPSKVGLPVGAEMTVETALNALIIKSANDCAVMLAEAVAGSEEAFVALMNDTAKRLGMPRTRFVNANGLPAGEQVTTARDLARLTQALIRDFPQTMSTWGLTEMQLGKIKLHNHNGLLKTFEGADGIKTGFTCDSGYNVVASATRDGRKLVAVVLGEPSGRDRTVRAAALLDHGFQTWDWKQVLDRTTLDSLPVAEPRPARSVRTTVASWNCNPHRRPKPVAKKGAAKKAVAKGQAGKKTKAAGAPNASAPDASAKPKAKAKAAKSAATGTAPKTAE